MTAVAQDLDADGILTVAAEEEFTGEKASVEVKPTYGLTDDEIEQMLEDAIDHAEDDIDERLLIAARIEGEQILHHIRKALTKDADLLTGDEGAVLPDLADQLAAALEGTDRQKILALGQRVDEASAAFAQRRIERDLALAIGGKNTDDVATALGVG